MVTIQHNLTANAANNPSPIDIEKSFLKAPSPINITMKPTQMHVIIMNTKETDSAL